MEPPLSKSWKTLFESPHVEGEFLLYPYIPREGKTLLFGVTSVGKSPLTFNMAYCIGEGLPFFGLPVTQAKVYYMELDSTEPATTRRIKKFSLPPSENVQFSFFSGLNIPAPRRQDVEEIMTTIREHDPGLIIVNTLRKAHDDDDKSSETSKRVYEWFDRMFPKKALLFVHHERKSPVDVKSREGLVDRERFSGSNAWMNDAQVAVHLRRDDSNGSVSLWHVKSQETELYRPLPLKLQQDGSHFKCPLFEELQVIQDILGQNPLAQARELDYKIGKALNVSERTARTRRTQMGDILKGGSNPMLTYLARGVENSAENCLA